MSRDIFHLSEGQPDTGRILSFFPPKTSHPECLAASGSSQATHLPGLLPCSQINCTHHFHTSRCPEAPLLAMAEQGIDAWALLNDRETEEKPLQQHKESSSKEFLPDANLLLQSHEEGRCQTAQIYFWLTVSPFKTLILHAEGDDPQIQRMQRELKVLERSLPECQVFAVMKTYLQDWWHFGWTLN